MRPLSASELLSVWEQGQGQSSIARALSLLAAAAPDQSPAKLSVGRRDALLLTLREKLFGTRLVSLVACPNCAERLELTFDSSEIRASTGEDQPESLTVKAGGYEARFRLPNSEDLLEVAAGAQRDAASASESLLSRCLLQTSRKGRNRSAVSVKSARDLPPALLAAIAEKMEQADPQADVRLNFNCDACGHRWSATFDIVSYLWSEIDDWARRILREVHVLASTYGWREADILGMSARRRLMYLQLLGV
jgi:hypothetical protein